MATTLVFGPPSPSIHHGNRKKSKVCMVLVVPGRPEVPLARYRVLNNLLLGKARKGSNVTKVRSPASLDPLFDHAL